MSDHLRLEFEGHRATITIERPDKRNMLEVADLNHFRALLDDVDSASEIRVLVVTGAGEKAFSAGFAHGEVETTDWRDNPIEKLTNRLEEEAEALIGRIDELGGAVAAIESGFPQREIDEAAYEYARRVERGDAVVVGLNRFVSGEEPPAEVLRVDADLEPAQVRSLARARASRDGDAVDEALAEAEAAARGDENLLPPMKVALRHGATVGEVAGTLATVFGHYRPGR